MTESQAVRSSIITRKKLVKGSREDCSAKLLVVALAMLGSPSVSSRPIEPYPQAHGIKAKRCRSILIFLPGKSASGKLQYSGCSRLHMD